MAGNVLRVTPAYRCGELNGSGRWFLLLSAHQTRRRPVFPDTTTNPYQDGKAQRTEGHADGNNGRTLRSLWRSPLDRLT
jgi:hypothetical protein